MLQTWNCRWRTLAQVPRLLYIQVTVLYFRSEISHERRHKHGEDGPTVAVITVDKRSPDVSLSRVPSGLS